MLVVYVELLELLFLDRPVVQLLKLLVLLFLGLLELLVALGMPKELDKDSCMDQLVLQFLDLLVHLVEADLDIVEMALQGSLGDIKAASLTKQFLQTVMAELAVLDIGLGYTLEVVITAQGIVIQLVDFDIVVAVLDTVKELNFRPIKDTSVEVKE